MAPANFFKVTVAESSLCIKMGFLRRYFGIFALQFMYISFFCYTIMLSPTARFYISENGWLLHLFCFVFCASYLSLLKIPLLSFFLLFHVGILGVAVAFIATYFDLMFLLQTILLLTFITTVLFVYTLQSQFDLNVWSFIIISAICVTFGSFSLNILLVGSEDDSIITIFVTVLLILYHYYGTSKILKIVSPNDYILAVISLHVLPINLCVFSSFVNKCTV